MSTDLENAKAQVAFWAEVGPILEEFEAAREDKKNDPERWKAAVQAMDGEPDGVRYVYRLLAQAQPVQEGEIVVGLVDSGVEVPGVS